jgi:ketol-acid reductoisomerase
MNFIAPPNHSVRREPKTEESRAHTVEDGEFAHRWHEESKRRYEELTHQWLELAEQRQRCT